MTAAEAVQLGPEGFNAWIDNRVYGRKRGNVHRSRMGKTWWFTQPAIGFMRKHPRKAVLITSAVFGVVLLWKVSTR